MRKNKLAALLAAIMMAMSGCPSTPAYAMAQEPAETAAKDEKQETSQEAGEEGDVILTREESQMDSETGTQDAITALLETLSLSPELLGVLLGGMDQETIELLLTHPDLLALFLPSLSVTVSDQAVTIRFRNREAKGDNDVDESSYEKGTVRTQGYNLHVRTGAGLDHEIITKLPDGSEVKVVGEENGWYRVEIPGYVYGEYLETTQAAPAAVTEEGGP